MEQNQELHVVFGAGQVGGRLARLVVLDNLYMIGPTGGAPINEDTPVQPCSRKGAIRAEAAERLFAAHRRGDVQAVAGRASDFYGPGGIQTHFADRFWKPVLAGKTARVLFNPDMPHTYHYLPDVAAGLAALGEAAAEDLGRAWMLPCHPAGTTRELADRFARALGRPVRVAGTPRWMRKAIGLFLPIVREIEEMLYQWDEPFIVDDRRFRERFGATPADAGSAAGDTVEWARGEYRA